MGYGKTNWKTNNKTKIQEASIFSSKIIYLLYYERIIDLIMGYWKTNLKTNNKTKIQAASIFTSKIIWLYILEDINKNDYGFVSNM